MLKLRAVPERGRAPGGSGDHWRARLSRRRSGPPSAFRCRSPCRLCRAAFLTGAEPERLSGSPLFGATRLRVQTAMTEGKRLKGRSDVLVCPCPFSRPSRGRPAGTAVISHRSCCSHHNRYLLLLSPATSQCPKEALIKQTNYLPIIDSPDWTAPGWMCFNPPVLCQSPPSLLCWLVFLSFPVFFAASFCPHCCTCQGDSGPPVSGLGAPSCV